MAGINYQDLYDLQDKVLETVFSVEKEFYLTGGTCLHRFYLNDRYSDDLDFFTNQSTRFSYAIKNLRAAFELKYNYQVIVETKNFLRFSIDNTLQVDFVNDVIFRDGEPSVTDKGYLIDTLKNIMSNKITAIMGRDDPKDVFDLYRIWKTTSFSWETILDAAHEKAAFENDELVVRLKTFPQGLFDQLKVIDNSSFVHYKDELHLIIEEIINKKDHICEKTS